MFNLNCLLGNLWDLVLLMWRTISLTHSILGHSSDLIDILELNKSFFRSDALWNLTWLPSNGWQAKVHILIAYVSVLTTTVFLNIHVHPRRPKHFAKPAMHRTYGVGGTVSPRGILLWQCYNNNWQAIIGEANDKLKDAWAAQATRGLFLCCTS